MFLISVESRRKIHNPEWKNQTHIHTVKIKTINNLLGFGRGRSIPT